MDGSTLVLPGSGSSSVRAAYLGYLNVTLRRFLSIQSEPPIHSADSDPGIASIVKSALGKDLKSTLACFAVPHVGTPIQCYVNRERWPELSEKIEQSVRQALPHLLLEFAVRELLPGTVEWRHGASPLSTPTIGTAFHPPADAAGWRFENGVATLLERSGPGPAVRLRAQSLNRGRLAVKHFRSELSYIPLEESIQLALADFNPIAITEAHPDKNGNRLDLGGHSEDDWRSSVKTALEWIRNAMPGLFDEMNFLLKQVVPVGYHAERHYSASFQESIGTIYMTLHPNVLTMAEALIHEFQHNKLNLATYTDEVLTNAFYPLYPSPVRPDPRPLWGVLLAVHAFLPVAAFYRALKESNHPVSRTGDFDRRLNEIDLKNKGGMDTLRAHAKWTPLGRELMDALEELDRRHMSERSAAGLECVPVTAHES